MTQLGRIRGSSFWQARNDRKNGVRVRLTAYAYKLMQGSSVCKNTEARFFATRCGLQAHVRITLQALYEIV